MTTGTAQDPTQYPTLRNLQYSPIKEGEEQYMVLWDPTGLSKDKLVLPLNYFFIIQHFDGEHSLAEIGALYLKRFGEFLGPSRMEQLVSDLNEKLFLEGQRAEEARKLADRSPSAVSTEYVIAKSGDPEATRQWLKQLDARTPLPWMPDTRRTFAYLGLGDTASALSALERATDGREIWPLVYPMPDPQYAPIRGSARYQALLRRVGLSPP